MIAGLEGKVKSKHENTLVIDINGILYEVLIPDIILNSIMNNYNLNDNISLVTFHYYQISPSKSIPVLIGFTNQIEKEFFVKFTSVSGVGPKVAVKAINKPISSIVKAIDISDVKFLSSLPGIGSRKAAEIIAKLKGKIGKYGLIQDDDGVLLDMSLNENLKEEALQVLLQLKYNKKEAEKMLTQALEQNPDVSSIEEILNQVYKYKAV